MNKLKLIREIELKREYELPDRRRIFIELEEDSAIDVTDIKQNKIGRFELTFYDDNERGKSPYYHITWMYLDLLNESYIHQGIGRECLKFFKEICGWPISASRNDGIQKDDGSHLTGDAPGFVSSMLKEKIIDFEI